MLMSFPPDIQEFVTDALAKGRYQSEEELVVNAVRMLRDRDRERERFVAELDRREAEVDRGDGIELEGSEELARFFHEIEEEVRTELAAKEDKSA